MANLLGTIRATAQPDHGLITVISTGLDDYGDPDFEHRQLCWAGTNLLYLFSASNSSHLAQITVEAWDRPPTDDHTTGWEAEEAFRLTSTTGDIVISVGVEFYLSPVLVLGPLGVYAGIVYAAGRHDIRALVRDPHRPDVPVGVERFLVRLWPDNMTGQLSA